MYPIEENITRYPVELFVQFVRPHLVEIGISTFFRSKVHVVGVPDIISAGIFQVKQISTISLSVQTNGIGFWEPTGPTRIVVASKITKMFQLSLSHWYLGMVKYKISGVLLTRLQILRISCLGRLRKPGIRAPHRGSPSSGKVYQDW